MRRLSITTIASGIAKPESAIIAPPPVFGEKIVSITAEVESVPATCTTAGSETYTAKFKNSLFTTQSKRIDIKAKGHTAEAVTALDPTCTEDGHTAYWHCTGCDKYFSDADCTTEITLASIVITALGHEYEDTIVPPTETEQGYTLHKCKRGDDEYKDTFTDPIPKPARKKGDINNNGKIDASDLLQVKSHIKRVKLLEGDDFTTADIDGNGSINAADLLRMKAHMKGVTLIWE